LFLIKKLFFPWLEGGQREREEEWSQKGTARGQGDQKSEMGGGNRTQEGLFVSNFICGKGVKKRSSLGKKGGRWLNIFLKSKPSLCKRPRLNLGETCEGSL